MCEEISGRSAEAETAIKELKSNHDFIRVRHRPVLGVKIISAHLASPLQSSVQDACIVVEQQFALLRAATKEARKKEVTVLEEEKMVALRQAESIQAHLEQRRAELGRTLTEMNKLSRRESDVDFLQVQTRRQHRIMGKIQHPFVDGPNKKSSASVKSIHLISQLVSPRCFM